MDVEKVSVQLARLTDAEQRSVRGPCSLCGTRKKSEPRGWRLIISNANWNEPMMEYLACSRCRGALRELAEIAFGDRLSGLLDFTGDLPY